MILNNGFSLPPSSLASLQLKYKVPLHSLSLSSQTTLMANLHGTLLCSMDTEHIRVLACYFNEQFPCQGKRERETVTERKREGEKREETVTDQLFPWTNRSWNNWISITDNK